MTYNHEEKSTYSVTVKADDDNGGTATVVVTITVTDVAEQPATPAKPTLAVVSSTSLTATWVKPGLNGGPDITGYNVNYRVSTATAWETFTHSGAGVTRTITGLTAEHVVPGAGAGAQRRDGERLVGPLGSGEHQYGRRHPHGGAGGA